MTTAVASPTLSREVSQKRWGIPIALWFIVAFVLNRFQEFIFFLRNYTEAEARQALTSLSLGSQGKTAWDTGAYVAIAEKGYRPGAAHEAFFPGYPLLIRLVNHLTHSSVLSGMYISLASGFIAAMLFWQWLLLKGFTVRQSSMAIALFLVYPYGFVLYGVVYADALLMACVMAALVSIEKRWYVLAGLAGAGATLSRPNSLALVVGLVVIALEQTGVLTLRLPARSLTANPKMAYAKAWQSARTVRLNLGLWQTRSAAVLLSVGGVASFSVWLAIKVGDPLYFWTVQSQYGRLPMTSPHMWLKTSFFYGRIWESAGWDLLNEAWCGTAFMLAVVALPSLGRKFGWGYAAFVMGLLVIIWTGTLWFSPGRYLLPAVPILIALVVPWLCRHRAVAAGVGIMSTVWFFALAAGFAGAFGIYW